MFYLRSPFSPTCFLSHCLTALFWGPQVCSRMPVPPNLRGPNQSTRRTRGHPFAHRLPEKPNTHSLFGALNLLQAARSAQAEGSKSEHACFTCGPPFPQRTLFCFLSHCLTALFWGPQVCSRMPVPPNLRGPNQSTRRTRGHPTACPRNPTPILFLGPSICSRLPVPPNLRGPNLSRRFYLRGHPFPHHLPHLPYLLHLSHFAFCLTA